MSYFVLLRDADDGSLRLLGPDVLSTREQALEAVSLALRDDPSLRSAGVFLAELEAASPILFVEPVPPPAPAAVEEPVGGGEPVASEVEAYEESAAEGAEVPTAAVFDYAAYEVAPETPAEAELPTEAPEPEPTLAAGEEPTAADEGALTEEQEEPQREPAEWQYAVAEEVESRVEPEPAFAEPGPVEPDVAPTITEAEPAITAPGPVLAEQGSAFAEPEPRPTEVETPFTAWEPAVTAAEAPEAPMPPAEQRMPEVIQTPEGELELEPVEASYVYAGAQAVPEVEPRAAEEAAVEAAEEQAWTPPLAGDQPPPEPIVEEASTAVDTSWPAATVAEDAEVLAAIASLGPPEEGLGSADAVESGGGDAASPAGETAEPESGAWPWTASVPMSAELPAPDEPVLAEFPITEELVEEPWSGAPPTEIAAGEVLHDVESPAAEPATPPEAATEAPVEEPAAFSPAYEPGGDLDLSHYTCDDCVYVNTCPKVGQLTPQECGSFQWRSS